MRALRAIPNLYFLARVMPDGAGMLSPFSNYPNSAPCAMATNPQGVCYGPKMIRGCHHAADDSKSNRQGGDMLSKRGCRTLQSTRPDLSQLSSILQSQWHHAKNAHLGHIAIKPNSSRNVWWTCDQCPDGHPHEWKATVSNRSSGTGCPFCARRAICPHSSLASQAPLIAAQFSSKNQGRAEDFTVGSKKVVMWQCGHGHEWHTEICNRTGKRQTGCPTCHAAQRRLPRKRHPTLLDSRHPVMQFWDWDVNSKAGYNPGKITCLSAVQAHWICHQCSRGEVHRWSAYVYSVTSGSRCPYCSGRRACVCNSVRSLHPDIAAEWDYHKNQGTPDDYTAGAEAKVWWNNDKRGSFTARVRERTSRQRSG